MPTLSRAAAMLLTAAVFSALAGAAASQDAAAPAVDNEALVVTATRTPTPVDQVGSSVTLITAADIEEAQWRTLPDALADAPGLNLVQTGGPGGFTSVFIRGANANHTKVIIDGVDANDPSIGGAFDFGQMATAGIARIEVLRGPQSSLYGSDAIGGVIAITTAQGSGPPRLTAAVEGGSFGSFDQTAGVSGSGGRFHYVFTLAHLRSTDTPVTPLDLLPPGRARIGDAYENLSLSTRLDADVAPGLAIGLVVRSVASDLRFTGDDFSVFPSVPAAAQTDQAVAQFFARGEARISLAGGKFANVLGLGFSRWRTRLQSPDVPFGPQAPSFDRGDRLKFDWQGVIALSPRETLVTGADYAQERLIDSPISATDRDLGVFGELQSAPFRGMAAAVSGRLDDSDRFGPAATWRIAPNFRIAATGTELKATWGTGFKAPSLTQLFVSFPAFGFFANPDLKPETSQGWDLGFEQPLAGGRLRLGATWFHNAIRNLIDTNAAGDSLANIGAATTYGAETFIAYAPAPSLKLRADYTYTIARDDQTGQELLRRPRHKASLSAAWRGPGRFGISGSLLYVGSWVDGNRSFSIPRLNAKAYVVANIAAAYELGRGVELFGRIDNLLDRRYEDPVGFQRPGLGAFAGVMVRLGGGKRGP
jgi:vitamin B12 transporter